MKNVFERSGRYKRLKMLDNNSRSGSTSSTDSVFITLILDNACSRVILFCLYCVRSLFKTSTERWVRFGALKYLLTQMLGLSPWLETIILSVGESCVIISP